MKGFAVASAALLVQLSFGTAVASAEPPPDSYFRKAQAVSAIEIRCARDNKTACRVQLKSIKSVGTRGESRIYCGTGIPLTGRRKGDHLRYRAIIRIGELPKASHVSTCRR
jgi:hypothetical protein